MAKVPLVEEREFIRAYPQIMGSSGRSFGCWAMKMQHLIQRKELTTLDFAGSGSQMST